ncbi:MAG: hypothetical protein LBJ00_06660 [Planctomycetaceae bacterium]|nr:hypothetical protein [Planctomycetaceae bacterium]
MRFRFWEIFADRKIKSYLMLYSSCFEIPEAAVNLQRRALGKRSIAKRLFKGEACRPYRLRYKLRTIYNFSTQNVITAYNGRFFDYCIFIVVVLS